MPPTLRADLASFLADLRGPGALVALVILAAPIAVGGVPLPARASLCGVACIAFLWIAHDRARANVPLRVGVLGWGFTLLTTWTFFQWLPLPFDLVETLAPATAQAHLLTAEALGADLPTWAALSLDRPRTAATWLSLVGGLALYLSVLNLEQRRDTRRIAGLLVELAALAVLIIGVLQTTLGVDRILGLYEPSLMSSSGLRATFVNPNHTAVLLLLGSFVALGLWLARRYEPRAARFHISVAVVLAVGVIATLSRANVMLLVAGLVVLVVLMLARDRGFEGARSVIGAIVGVACVAAVVVLAVGGREWIDELLQVVRAPGESLGPARAAWGVGVDVVGEHLVFGTGHGAFAMAAAGAMGDWRLGFADYAHNGVIQAVAEWGLPMTVLAGGLVAWGCLRALRRGLSRLELFGALIGLGALLVQNQVDFSWSIPGVMYPALAVLAWVVADTWYRTGEPSRAAPARRAKWRWVYSLVLVGGLAATGYDAVASAPGPAETQLEAAAGGEPLDDGVIAELIAAHPADFRLAGLGALASRRLGHQELSRQLAERAAALAPNEPGTLMIAARLRLEAGATALAGETLIRLVTVSPVHHNLVHELIWQHQKQKGLLDGFYGHDPGLALVGARQLHRRKQHEASRKLLRWAIARFPDAVYLSEELGSQLAKDKDAEAALRDLSTQILARAGSIQDPAVASKFERAGFLLEGYRLKRLGQLRGAYHSFVATARLDTDRALRPLLEAADVLAKLGDMEGVAQLMEQLRHRMDKASRGQRAQYHELASAVAEHQDKHRLAVRELNASLRYRPRNPIILHRLANLFESAGEDRAARRVRARLALLTRGGPAPSEAEWRRPEQALETRQQP